jgi:hypothetical protein
MSFVTYSQPFILDCHLYNRDLAANKTEMFVLWFTIREWKKRGAESEVTISSVAYVSYYSLPFF